MSLPPLPPKDLLTITPQKTYSSEAMRAYAHAAQLPLLDKILYMEELLLQCQILLKDVQEGLRCTGVTAPMLDSCLDKITNLLERINVHNVPKRTGY